MGYPTLNNEADIELLLNAIAVCPTKEAAAAMVKEVSGKPCTEIHLNNFERLRHERLAEIRKALTPRLEQELSDGMLDNARLAQIAINSALVRTQERLDRGLCSEPDKVARNLADVAAKSIDKKLALEGRPTQINETKSVSMIISELERLNVIDAEAVDG